MAGIAGVDPGPFTFRKLSWMVDAINKRQRVIEAGRQIANLQTTMMATTFHVAHIYAMKTPKGKIPPSIKSLYPEKAIADAIADARNGLDEKTEKTPEKPKPSDLPVKGNIHLLKTLLPR